MNKSKAPLKSTHIQRGPATTPKVTPRPAAPQTVARRPQPAGPAAPVQRTTCACGGELGADGQCAACRERKAAAVQRKMAVNAPGDAHEQEADQVARAHVQRQVDETAAGPTAAPVQRKMDEATPVQRQMDDEAMPVQRRAADEEVAAPVQRKATESEKAVQRQAVDEDETTPVQREATEMDMPIQRHAAEEEMVTPVQRASDAAVPEVTPEIESGIEGARGGGSALPPGVQRSMENTMGADLSGVRVHSDDQADRLSRQLDARAFTSGQDIFFKQGEYNPGSRGGEELLAHEMAHTVQQGGGAARSSPGRQRVGPDEQSNRLANQSAVSDKQSSVRESPATKIQRSPNDTWQAAKDRALAIKDALVDHFTEDEEKALNQIRNQSVLMLKEIRAQYKLVTGDRILESDFEKYTSSSQYKEALSLLNAVLPLEDRLRTNIDSGWVFDTENEKGILEVLRHASRPELDDLAQNNPGAMSFLKKALNEDEYYQARKILTPNGMFDIVVERIKNAEGTFNDDESAVYNALLDLTPQDRRRVWEEHQDIFEFLNGDEKASVRKMCLGSEADALKERMKVATDGWGTDDDAVKLVVEKTQSAAQQERAIEQAIKSGKAHNGKPLTPEELTQLQTRQKELGGIQQNLLTAEYEGGELKGGSFLEMMKDDVSSAKYQSFAGSMGVSTYQLAKQQILDAIGTFSDDEEAIYKAFDRLVGQIELPQGSDAAKLTPQQRAQAQQLANQKLRQQLYNDPDIKDKLKNNLNAEELKQVDVYVSADTYQIALKKLQEAYEGVDTDEEGIFKIITEMSPADRERIKSEQPRIYLKLLNPAGSLNAEEREMVRVAFDTGKIPTDMALNWAFGGWGDGTEEEMLEQTFAAMEAPERYLYRLGYFLFRGGSLPANNDKERQQQADARDKFQKLYQRMNDELGTDDLQKSLDQLLGLPTLEELKSEQGRLMVVGIMNYRVGEKGDIRENDSISSAIMDTFSESGEVTDQSEARFASAYRLAMADGKLTDEEFATLAALDADFAQKYEGYVSSVDQVTNIASTVAAVAVGIVVTVASGGSAGPAVAGLLAEYGAAALVGGVAGAATKVGVSELVGGSHFDTASTEGLLSAASGFADGAMAVLSAGLAGRFTNLIGLGKSALAAELTAGILRSSDAALAHAGKAIAGAGLRSSIEGFLAGAVGELILTAADQKVYQQSIWGIIQSYGLAILKGGGLGAATGVLTGGALEALGTYVGVKRLQGLVGQLEAAGLNQHRLSVMSQNSLKKLGQIDNAIKAGQLDEAAEALATLRKEMSPDEIDGLWRGLGKHHLGKDIGPFPGSAADKARYKKLLQQIPDAAKLDALIAKVGDSARLEQLLQRITNPVELERLINRAALPGSAADPNAVTRLERALNQLGPGAHSPADAESALDALKILDGKILQGRTVAPVVPGVTPTGEARRIIGAHSPEILNDPANFNILSQVTNPDGTITAKFQKLVSPGPPPVYSQPKVSTLAPSSWTSGDILAAGDRVAARPIFRGPRTWGSADNATLHMDTVNGVQWAVIKDGGGRVTSSFPTGGQPPPF